MTPEIYGNDAALRLIRTMAASGRLPHACLLWGEAGTGRKTIAHYLAMAALCTGPHPPCGTCPSCRKLLHGSHPDLTVVEHSGKKNGFSVETVRHVCKDAIVAPNDGACKVYLFADCDYMDVRAQNTLLKLTEEPPPHVRLLFTAAHPEAFLETMRSRMMSIPIRQCTREECRTALTTQHGYAPAEAARAAEACGGSIGRALAWLADEGMQTLTGHAAALTDAAADGTLYEMLRILAGYEKDRQSAAALLRLLDLQVRDALVMQYGQTDLAGCDRESAAHLSKTLTAGRAEQMHDAIREAQEALLASVSVRLVLSALGGRLCMISEKGRGYVSASGGRI